MIITRVSAECRTSDGPKPEARDSRGRCFGVLTRPQSNDFSRGRGSVGANLIAPVSLRPIQSRISHLNQLNRIPGVLRVGSHSNADGNVMGLDWLGAVATNRGELMLFDPRSDPFRGDQPLRIVSVEQKRRKLFAAKAGPDIAGAQRFSDYRPNFLKRLAADQMAIGVVHFFEVVY